MVIQLRAEYRPQRDENTSIGCADDYEADWIRRSQSGTLSRHYYTEVVQVQEGERKALNYLLFVGPTGPIRSMTLHG